jgi:hypothetical protein
MIQHMIQVPKLTLTGYKASPNTEQRWWDIISWVKTSVRVSGFWAGYRNFDSHDSIEKENLNDNLFTFNYAKKKTLEYLDGSYGKKSSDKIRDLYLQTRIKFLEVYFFHCNENI